MQLILCALLLPLLVFLRLHWLLVLLGNCLGLPIKAVPSIMRKYFAGSTMVLACPCPPPLSVVGIITTIAMSLFLARLYLGPFVGCVFL